MGNFFRKAALVLLIASSLCAQERIKYDIIKPLNLTAGRTDSMLISDLIGRPVGSVVVTGNKNVAANYNAAKGIIYFKPDLKFAGATILDLKIDSQNYSVITRSRIMQKYKFSFKPYKKYGGIYLFGSFNGWDRGNLPMHDYDGDGVYEAEVPLGPGRYEYKFFADGIEIVDPANPDKKPNGMGNFNSLFNVPEPKLGKLFLHIGGKKIDKNKSSFGFIYENEEEPGKLKKSEVLALLNNNRVSDNKIKLNGNRVEISLNRKELKGKNLLRVCVSRNGRATNIQSVYMYDGIPASNEMDKFNWHDAVIYSLMIDRFNDGDKSLNNPVKHDSLADKANYMGGDLQGIIDKINEGYFNRLGVNTIWISPVYDNPNEAFRESPAPHRYYSGYHGYWPVNSFAVEEKFGTLEKLKELVSTAHKNGIKILLDIVANHVHEYHPLFKEKPAWFGNLKLPDGRLNLRLWDEQRLTTWFEPYLPKFNYVNSKEAIDFSATNALWWLINSGADGFRQDAVKHIPNEFWRTLTAKLKSEIEIPLNREVYQIGETFGSYELISSYVNNGQLSAQFNFNLYDTALPVLLDERISFKALDAEMKKSFLVYGENHLMGNIMDSHDKNRFMAFADGDLDITQWSAVEEGWKNPPEVNDPANYEKAKLYLAYMNSIPGLPVIYYGSEFGMTGASDPDNRRMMRFGNELSEAEQKKLSDVSTIINTRRNHPALRYGDFLTLAAEGNLYAYIRSDMNERILILLNKGREAAKISLDLPVIYKIEKGKDILSGEEFKIVNGKLELEIKGTGWRFVEIK